MAGVQRVKHRLGRPASITADVEERLLSHVRVGVPVTRAARLAGISDTTFFRAMDRGANEQARVDHLTPDDAATDEPDPIEDDYRQFRHRVLIAKDEAVARAIVNMQQAARGGYVTEKTTRRFRDGSVEETERRTAPDWRAADKLLRYTAPEDFETAASRVEVTGSGGGPVLVEHDARLAALAERLAVVAAERAAITSPDDGGGDVVDGEVVDGS